MTDMRFTPTHRIDDNGLSIRVDRPEYNDIGDNLFTCGWCFSVVREIDTSGHTGWHRALTDKIQRARAT